MTAATSGFRAFAILWCGQFVSLTGSALAGFGLGVYVYRITGSVTTLGFVYALAYLPLILASPVAGSLVDRWGPWRALLVSNVGSMLAVLTLAGLLATETFDVWHLYVFVAVNSTLRALQMPAFESSVPLLVPKQHLGRANGIRMLALAASEVLAPVSAGALLLSLGIKGIVLLDGLSFGLALLTLIAIRIPKAVRGGPAATAGTPTLLGDFREAWRQVRKRHGLLALLVFIGALNFCAGFVDLLITPLVLSFGSPGALGTVMSIGGLGMIAASVAMSAWGGPRRKVHGVLGFSLVLATAIVLGALRPNVILVGGAAFLFLASLAVVITSNQTLWQSKVEPYLMGRTMALQNMVASAPQLVAYAMAGLLADRVFEPLVGRDQVRHPVLAALVGDGPGRGIALLLMVMGLLTAVCVAVAWAYRPLRRLEDDLPDATPDRAEDAVPAGDAARL
ncbi:Major Facilitator Superfamily protein [Micromonospora sediminicola]|uniref:Major Facilitator Superfamily protein n=1 Tax=Micromonospora sediminicola TaxID=946078 RepID=A0A1A9B9Q9_9ACTN|nr:MFS transporter [Micromonospora sediminicola]SBT65709.1 Major Facilitator Superfamily protein [Micromonospora sediminicola]